MISNSIMTYQNSTRILILALLLCPFSVWSQKEDIYIDTSGKIMTHSQAQMAVYGDIINDALGGIDNNNGGRVYIFRTAAQSATPSRIYDGPNADTSTGMYNNGAPYIRIFDLITDNSTQSSIPSGSLVNASSGGGDIQIEQELRVTNEHILINGIIWTPRDQWKHAYLLYEDHAFHTGAGPNNTAGPHVDGYVAYEGTGSFIFPIGNGVVARKAGLKNPDQGIYRAAYFHRNPQLGTPGISGTSASTGPLGPSIYKISTQEFWDIDGTALTNITLGAQNGGQNYSAWDVDFLAYHNDSTIEIGIAGWDDWEYLGNQTPTNSIHAGGYYTTTTRLIPDSMGAGGSPYAVFTWATAVAAKLGLDDIDLSIVEHDCHALINFTTLDEENTKSAHIIRTQLNGTSQEIAELPLKGNTIGEQSYSFTDEEVHHKTTYLYSVHIESLDGTVDKSKTVPFVSGCDDHSLWEAYPNPTTGKLSLEVNADMKIKKIEVHDISGRLVYEMTVEPHQRKFEMDISAQPQGSYVITVYDIYSNLLYTAPVLKK